MDPLRGELWIKRLVPCSWQKGSGSYELHRIAATLVACSMCNAGSTALRAAILTSTASLIASQPPEALQPESCRVFQELKTLGPEVKPPRRFNLPPRFLPSSCALLILAIILHICHIHHAGVVGQLRHRAPFIPATPTLGTRNSPLTQPLR